MVNGRGAANHRGWFGYDSLSPHASRGLHRQLALNLAEATRRLRAVILGPKAPLDWPYLEELLSGACIMEAVHHLMSVGMQSRISPTSQQRINRGKPLRAPQFL